MILSEFEERKPDHSGQIDWKLAAAAAADGDLTLARIDCIEPAAA